MHELSLIQSILDIAQREARARSARRIGAVRCRIGVLCQVSDALLQEVFLLAREHYPLCRQARLDVEYVGMRLECRACGADRRLADWEFQCPVCESERIQLSGGDDMELTSLEMEVDHEDRNPQTNPV